MRQVFHIFTKDARQFRLLIGLVVFLTALFAWHSARPWSRIESDPAVTAFRNEYLTSPVNARGVHIIPRSYATADGSDALAVLLLLSWWALIAEVIQADRLVGDRQFWLTRPYDRRSLWTAKALLLLTSTSLPMLVAQAALVKLDGLSIVANIFGLLASQALLVMVAVIPCAALAAVTATIGQFALSALAPAAVVMFYLESAGFGLGTRFSAQPQPVWAADAVAVTVIVATSVAVLAVQFLSRRTTLSCVLGVIGGTLALVAWTHIPWTAGFVAQSKLDAPLPDPIRVEILQPSAQGSGQHEFVSVPFRVAGGGHDASFLCNWVDVTLTSPSGVLGQHMPYGLAASMRGMSEPFDVYVSTPTRYNGEPLTIRATLYLTIYGPSEATSLAPAALTPVPGVGVCGVAAAFTDASLAWCRTAFRSVPSSAVWINGMDADDELLGLRSIPSGPFPADLALNPVLDFHRIIDTRANAVTMITRAPVAHVRVNVERTAPPGR